MMKHTPQGENVIENANLNIIDVRRKHSCCVEKVILSPHCMYMCHVLTTLCQQSLEYLNTAG